MEFEFDPAKSDANRTKHGIDFDEAKQLWEDPDLLEVSARSTDEARGAVIGMIGSKHWSAIFTHRDGRIRLISVRRARDEEVKRYEGK